MNEQEIVDYLKENKTKCVAFGFMPEDVQAWCMIHKDEPIFNVYISYGWNDIRVDTKTRIHCYYQGVHTLPDDYELEPGFKPHWQEFDVAKDGIFFTISDKIYHYHWWDWMNFLNCHHDKYNNFGGWLYGGRWELMPNATNNEDRRLHSYYDIRKNDIKPAIPSRIRFWRYKE